MAVYSCFTGVMEECLRFVSYIRGITILILGSCLILLYYTGAQFLFCNNQEPLLQKKIPKTNDRHSKGFFLKATKC